MKKFLIAPLAALAMLTTGCATIVSDSEYPVAINSTPADAAFKVFNEAGVLVATGTTPEVVTLAAGDGFFSKATYSVEFAKGKSEVIVPITPSVDGWVIGNVFIGGLIGLVVDGATGAMYKLPANVAADLNVDQAALTIIDVAQVPAGQLDALERIN